MKAKHKTSEQIYHQIIPMPHTHLVKLIAENDSYLDNIQSKIVSLNDKSAELEISFTRKGVKTAVQRVKISQHDHLASHVAVYPVYSESQQRSWFFPLAFLLLLFVLVNLAIRSTGLSIMLMLAALSVFAYLGVRYLEENSGKLIEYNEEDGKLLLNMLQISILPRKYKASPSPESQITDFGRIEPARPEVELSAEFRLDDIEAATLDDETLLERKELHRKLEDLD